METYVYFLRNYKVGQRSNASISVTPLQKTSRTIKILNYTIWLSFLVSLIIFTALNNSYFTKDRFIELHKVFTFKVQNSYSHKKKLHSSLVNSQKPAENVEIIKREGVNSSTKTCRYSRNKFYIQWIRIKTDNSDRILQTPIPPLYCHCQSQKLN